MPELISEILPLSLGAAISPTVLAAAILVLSGEAYPRARAVAYVAGAAAVVVAIGIAGLLTLGETVASSNPGPTRASHIIDLTLGVLLLALGARILVRGPLAGSRRGGSPDPDGAARQPRRVRFFVLGVAMMATNFTTLALYVPLLKQIARSGVAPPGKAATLAVADLIILMPALLPLFIYVTAPTRSAAVLAHLNRFVQRNAKYMTAALAGGFGVYLTVKGLDGLS